MVNKVLKSFGTLCVITYVIVTAISREPTQSISSAVSISVVLYGIYATILWKYNPFEKTPYIGGTYHAKHWSSYENKHESESTIVIKQTLFSLSLSEGLQPAVILPFQLPCHPQKAISGDLYIPIKHILLKTLNGISLTRTTPISEQ